ncbi:MAG: hypothetical protein EOO45_04520 [Flavobacterium sp.]|nr:MAG: hypothetical protein EOO45_04520 [Flavobacterium sp.]
MKIKKITSVLFLLLLPFLLSAQVKDCTKFKNGKFRLKNPKTKKIAIITRDGDKQTEKMQDEPEEYDFDIKWIDACSYTVTPTPATSARNKKVVDLGTMTVTITKMTDSSYTQTVKIANYPKYRRTDEMIIVKEKTEL